jgi:hypothetical protein
MATWREKIWAVIESAEAHCAALDLSAEDRETWIRAAKPHWCGDGLWPGKLWQEEMRRLFGRRRRTTEPPLDPQRPLLPGM